MHFRLLAITALASHSTAASQGYPHQDAPASTCMCSPSTDPTAALTIPAPTSVPSDKQKTLDEDNKALAREVSAEVTNFQRFNKLLTVDGEGTDLLPVDQLQQRVVFTFRTAPDQGEGGRFKLANVKRFPHLDTARHLNGRGLSEAVQHELAAHAPARHGVVDYSTRQSERRLHPRERLCGSE